MICPNRQALLTSVPELAAGIGRSDLRIVDCRFDLLNPDAGREAYREGHIPGAVYADLDRDLAAPITNRTGRHPLPDEALMAATWRRLGVSGSTTVVVYDDSGGAMAARAWWLLRWLGHENVTLLDGGLPCWQGSGLPLEPGMVTVADGDFTGTARMDRVVTTADVAAKIGAGEDLLLVDARDAARFRGDAEPIDAVAGHIPGTRNLPFTDTLAEDGSFRGETELRELWDQVAEETPEPGWAVMCGSGVTACHLAISAQLAGLPEPAVYVGSWSEWIRDPSRPVATGLR